MVAITLFSTVLLATTAFAFPSSIGSRSAPPSRRSLQRIEAASSDATPGASLSNNWAGAAWSSSSGTFTSVTGTFKVPTPKAPEGSASVWVGIDGNTCAQAIFQAGIYVNFLPNGVHSYQAWYEWYPDFAYDFTGISIDSGDELRLTVTSTSTTSGIAKIENLTKKQTVQEVISSRTALCRQDVEWIVEDFTQNNENVPFCNFDVVEFTDAYAKTTGAHGGSVTPKGAEAIILVENGQAITSVDETSEGVTIKHA